MGSNHRRLDYCGIRSILGRQAADEAFERLIPEGIDMDHPGDQLKVESIVRDREAQDARCRTCPDQGRCDPPVPAPMVHRSGGAPHEEREQDTPA